MTSTTLSSRLLLALSFAPILAAQTQFSTDLLALSPLGYWPLHGTTNDASGHGNNGTPTNGTPANGPAFTSFVGPLGTAAAPAAVFTSGFQTSVSIPAPANSVFNRGALQPLTALAWIKTTTQGLGFMCIVCKFDPVAGTGWGIGIDNGDLGGPLFGGRFMVVFVVANNPVLAVESSVPVTDGLWHFVEATYDGSGKANGVRLYLDGVRAGTSTNVDSLGSNSILNSAPLVIGNIPDGTEPFEGNVNEVAIFGVALTPDQSLQLAEDAVGFKRLLAQFAFGGGWSSAIYLANGSSSQLSFPVTFTGDNGSPLNLPAIGGSSTTIILPPGGTTAIEAPNQGDLHQGYVSVILPVGVVGYGVFRQSVQGVADQEAVVPLGPANSGFQALLYDDTGNFVTAVAIVNPSSVATTVTVTVLDATGKPIGTSTVALQPYSKTEAVLRSLPGLSQIAGSRGTVVFTTPPQTTPTPTGSVSILGLRFNGVAFTSIPATGRARGDF
jgi:hypothetical protein